ncbi:MAG TPA: TonB family protein [Polyangia bacterium]|nr:TonB family protein [Polyangia bacterium]
MQMVDQDQFPDEQDNADARFLGQKNHRTEKDQTAKNTNLVRPVESPNTATSEPNQNRDPDVGGKDHKIAELENHDGAPKTMPRSGPLAGDEGTRVGKSQAQGPLTMRDLTPRSSVKNVEGQKQREGVELQERETGDLPMARIGRDAERGRAAQKGGHIKLSLDHHQYDEIEGYDTAEKERHQAARAESSHVKGRYDRYLAKAQAMRSSIENFVMDVKPGNQQELGTRASPFAAYITAMHRQIHKLWTFGFLSDIDLRTSKNDLYANLELWTQLEIVVKPDGTVDKVGIVRSSGVLPFDVAAIDSVMSAAPFPVPPQAIRSANGKVYMDWQFHRDDRACGTFGVDPYILTTPGDNTEHDTSETGAGAKEVYDAARAAQVHSTKRHEAHETREEGPRTLEREPHQSAPSVRPRASAELAPPPVPEVTPEVHAAAEGWLAAYARGDARWLAGWSATPFTAAGETVAKDADALKAMYKQLLAEAPAQRKVESLDVLTPAGIRGRLGGLPPGGEDSDMLFAVGKAGGEEFILLLKKSDQGWRVCGIDR